jgi:kynurenine formamidase
MTTVWDLTDENRRAALAIPRAGLTVDLSVPMAPDMPQGPRETFGGYRLTPYRTPAAVRNQADPPPFDFSMELVSASIHVGTHLDGLAHIHSRGRMHGGLRTADEYADFGWRANGAEHIPPVLTRGVLLDVAGHAGAPMLADDHTVTPEELDACATAAGVDVRPGDAVLVRTGKIADFKAGRESYFAPAPGIGRAAGVWLRDRGAAVVGTDTSGTEPQPLADPTASTHEALLVDGGVLLLEILDLDELAALGATEFLLVCLPLRLVGATGSWVRPVAVL